jgi:hypothetical protein
LMHKRVEYVIDFERLNDCDDELHVRITTGSDHSRLDSTPVIIEDEQADC